VQEDKIEWREGAFHPVGGPSGNGKKPMGVKDLGPLLTKTGGPVMGSASVLPKAIGAGFGVHIADVEVDPDTGKTTILRYTAIHDVGRAIHPSYVEGQIQGGALQGIGWALNEEYMFNDKAELMNAGFLDYRMPTMLDAPNIETILVEVPTPTQPYGVRGIGETPIVPPISTLHNAIARALGIRIRALPMSPPNVLAALKGQHPMAEKMEAAPVAARS
jgi:CO/xanthine dehydrogenase Mo-binding subunit